MKATCSLRQRCLTLCCKLPHALQPSLRLLRMVMSIAAAIQLSRMISSEDSCSIPFPFRFDGELLRWLLAKRMLYCVMMRVKY